MLLNLSIFIWFGAVCPWDSFVHNDIIPIYRLIALGILILLFRRIPIIYLLHYKIRQIEEKQQALFAGFFGPIGVSAVFYLYISLEFLKKVTVEGVVRDDAVRLAEVMNVVIWFLAICSIVSPYLQISASFDPLTRISRWCMVSAYLLGSWATNCPSLAPFLVQLCPDPRLNPTCPKGRQVFRFRGHWVHRVI